MLLRFFKKLEHIVDLLIPYALVLLIGILVTEFTKPAWNEQYKNWIEGIDILIVSLFVLDLLFKYHHSKTIPQFLKSHWLEIIAVFPFFLIFRLLDGLGLLTFAVGEAAIKEGQSITHAVTAAEKEVIAIERTISTAGREAEAVAKTASTVEKEAAAIARTVSTVEKEAVAVSRTASTLEREAAGIVRLTRAQRLARFVKPLFDSRRTMQGAHFFEHPKHRKTSA